MKRVNNLYKDIRDFNNIIKMTDKVCIRVRNKEKVNRFECFKIEHIYNVKKRLDNRELKVGKYNIFMINDPKCRIVMAQDIEDKIINHLVAEYVLVKVFENKYINSMVATRIGKGTKYGVKLLKKYLVDIKRNNDNIYYLKIDIHKYFYKMDHEVLKDILNRKIKDKDALDLLYKIIDSTNEEYVNKGIKRLKRNRINYLKDSNLLNKEKLILEVEEIPLYEYGKGVALGNQTSQAFGLIYLYEVCHFIKEELHIKYLINYMDDFVIIHSDKKYLKYCLEKIEIRLKKYKLSLNPKKTRIDSIKVGIDFLGYKFYVRNNKVIMRVRNRTKKNFKRKVKKLKFLYNNRFISKRDLDHSISSYKGIIKLGNCDRLYYKIINGE